MTMTMCNINIMRRRCLLLVLLSASLGLFPLPIDSLQSKVSRRNALKSLISPALIIWSKDNVAAETTTSLERDALLSAIQRGASESEVLAAIQQLIPLDPSKGKVRPEILDGEWKLLWSAKAEAFSPLLQLPRPFTPSSYQYFGEIAAREVGDNRVAQGLTGGILGANELWLSSGVEVSEQDSTVLNILPPFRFQLGGRPGVSTSKRTLVESGSDAEFRANILNSRTKEAQLAPKNEYQQLYTESTGTGSIRISTIRSGDPVIVGAIFVHKKL